MMMSSLCVRVHAEVVHLAKTVSEEVTLLQVGELTFSCERCCCH